MTLIEVLVSLVILSVLLGSVLVARARMARLKSAADSKLDLIAATNNLITAWWIKDRSIPRNASGQCGATSYFHWETRRVQASVNFGDGMDVDGLEIVRLTVVDTVRNTTLAQISVDLLVSSATPDATTQNSASVTERP